MIRISVITPIDGPAERLKLCAASVADQTGAFEVEHIIEDARAGEPQGIGEAVRRGLGKATGDIVAWIDPDDQYLPGALAAVAKYFAANPQTDIAFGDAVQIDEGNDALAYQQALIPSPAHVRHCGLETFPAATFVRAKVLQAGILPEGRWKAIADAVWVERILNAGHKAGLLGVPVAAITWAEGNLRQSPGYLLESREWRKETGSDGEFAKALHAARHHLAKLMCGAFRTRKVTVALHRDTGSGRIQATAMLGGRSANDADRTEGRRVERDGEIGGFRRTPKWSDRKLFAVCAAIMGSVAFLEVMVEQLVITPFLLSASLILIAPRCAPRRMILVAAAFWLLVWWSLYQMPAFSTERLIVRLLTFLITSTLAVLWNLSSSNSEEWIRSTIGLIRNLPVPLLVLSSKGTVMMVNRSGCAKLHIDEGDLQGKNIDLLLQQGSRAFATWDQRIPKGPVRLDFGSRSSAGCPGEVFVVGRGRRKLFGIRLGDAE